MASGIEQRARIHGLLAGRVTIQIVEKCNARTRPALANEIHLFGSHPGEIEASANRERREARIVFYAAQALFGHREKHFAIAGDARRGIVHLRIIDPEGNHVCRSSGSYYLLAVRRPKVSESLRTIASPAASCRNSLFTSRRVHSWAWSSRHRKRAS